MNLFLPKAFRADDVAPILNQSRTGYLGKRRKVLVVDNEDVDRELVINILQPLGFEMAEASTGQECLVIYTIFKPDIILMDLAMPVMDGWEASYIIRKIHQADTIIGIVSANAFDQNLENAADIDSSDFIVKPVNVEELLNWIGKKLALEWVTAEKDIDSHLESIDEDNKNALASAALLNVQLPPQEMLNELLISANIGHVKGINKTLAIIEQSNENYTDFVARMRDLSSQFQIEEMKMLLNEMVK